VEEAARAHDAAILDCLACILDRHDGSLFGETHSPSAAFQAAMPTQLGGLGLSSAELTSAPAYLASWIDFLRFDKTHPSFLPALKSVISPHALENSDVYAVQELREAWNVLDFDLSRTDPSSDVHVDGKYVLQSVLGSQVKSVRDLVLAPSHSQKPLTLLVMRASEREWRAQASLAERIRLPLLSMHARRRAVVFLCTNGELAFTWI
jgi:hypothetical protein